MKKTITSITELALAAVFPNPDQPRKDFDQEKLEELAMSIRECGVLEPIVVTPRRGAYMIIAGERRFRASLLAGLGKIPARVIEADDALVEELALLENIQRQDLNIIEEGKAYQRLLDRGWSVEDLAKKLGYKKTGPIYDRLSLLNLQPEYQDLVIKGGLTPLQAYEISRLPKDKQEVVYQKVVKGELNTYNKLYAFVTAMINIEAQGEIFALAPLTAEEKMSIATFDSLLGSVEKFIRRVHDQDKAVHLQWFGSDYRADQGQVSDLKFVIIITFRHSSALTRLNSHAYFYQDSATRGNRKLCRLSVIHLRPGQPTGMAVVRTSRHLNHRHPTIRLHIMPYRKNTNSYGLYRQNRPGRQNSLRL